MCLLLTYLVALSTIVLVHAKISCIGENGKPVDMFMIYKLPNLKDEADVPHLDEGKAYAYLNSAKPTFRLASHAITDKESSLGRTLNQVYDSHHYNPNNVSNSVYSGLAHVFYNDEEPEGHRSFGSYGHTKGALAFDKDSGFWLIHSVPRFPRNALDGYEYPETGLRYGQSMICVTFGSKSFDEIGQQLIFDHPHIHDSHLPSKMRKFFPNIQKLLTRGRVKKAPFSRIANLKSSGGVDYRHYAKYTRFHKDLYHDLVAIDLKTDLLTETWQHGHDIGPSCSGDYKVEDADSINVKLSSDSISFSTMNDHSKFAIGKTSSMPYICIGDINRQPSQFKRGGGTLCFKNFDIWNQYYKFIESYIGCE